MSNVSDMPMWKVGATAHERLAEICRSAELRPQTYQKVVVVYCGDKGVNWVSADCSGPESATLLSIAVRHAVRCAEQDWDEGADHEQAPA